MRQIGRALRKIPQLEETSPVRIRAQVGEECRKKNRFLARADDEVEVIGALASQKRQVAQRPAEVTPLEKKRRDADWPSLVLDDHEPEPARRAEIFPPGEI